MQMKINEKILSIPPYISTTWVQVAALRMKGSILVVTLKNEEAVNVPGLSVDQINLIFSHHAAFLEKEVLPSSLTTSSNLSIKEEGSTNLESTTLSFAFGSIDGFNTIVRHNPAQSDSPDLPAEVLHKISEIARVIIPLEDFQVPKAEPHCNCFHCQIARAVQSAQPLPPEPQLQSLEEEVPDEELQFQQWSIIHAGEHLYNVVNRLDEHEKYSVYLGHPVGCTCGKAGCEHILAVLKS